jgi:hypothetical protein
MSYNSATRRTETAGMVCHAKAGKLQHEVRIGMVCTIHQQNSGGIFLLTAREIKVKKVVNPR